MIITDRNTAAEPGSVGCAPIGLPMSSDSYSFGKHLQMVAERGRGRILTKSLQEGARQEFFLTALVFLCHSSDC